jgi:hypothetical protein
MLHYNGSRKFSTNICDAIRRVTVQSGLSIARHLHNRFQPDCCLSQFSPLLVTSDNRINPQSDEMAVGSPSVNRILIMIEQRKDSNSHSGCHFRMNRARTLQEPVTHDFDPKSLHLLVLLILS